MRAPENGEHDEAVKTDGRTEDGRRTDGRPDGQERFNGRGTDETKDKLWRGSEREAAKRAGKRGSQFL